VRTRELLDYRRRERGWTRQLVAAVPEAAFDWAPAANAFSCGGLVRHMMQSEMFYRRLLVAAARGEHYDPFAMGEDGTVNLVAFRESNLESSRSERAARLGTSFAALLGRWDEIGRETVEALSQIADQDLARPMLHPLGRARGPVWELFLVMIGHEVHHRGQLSAYLKVLGVEQPPLYTQLEPAGA
jgi:uncharacterized damage-inducible protein DinB